MSKIKVTQMEWDKIADDFAERHAGHTRSLSEAVGNLAEYMSRYKIINTKKLKEVINDD